MRPGPVRLGEFQFSGEGLGGLVGNKVGRETGASRSRIPLLVPFLNTLLIKVYILRGCGGKL